MRTPKIERMVDELGHIKARVADLTAQEKRLKSELANYCANPAPGNMYAFEGRDFRATVSLPLPSEVTDWRAVAERLEPSRQLVRAHTSTKLNAPRVSVKARVRDAA